MNRVLSCLLVALMPCVVVGLAGDLNSVQGLTFHEGRLYIAHSNPLNLAEFNDLIAFLESLRNTGKSSAN